MAPKYLYAAVVQGIQDFIFQTNKLQEIAGASELVEQICTKEFEQIFPTNKYNCGQLLIGAAGNIKYLFDDTEKKLCEKIFRDFPFEVALLAPGITISQTVVVIEKGEINSGHINTAEQQLKVQRNLPTRPNMALMIAKRTPKTGKPVVGKDKDSGEWIDAASAVKICFSKKATTSLVDKIMSNEQKNIFVLDNKGQCMTKDDNSWLAVIHADGNDLGKLIPTFFKEVKGDKFVRLQREMSKILDDSTTNAAKKAFDAVLKTDAGKKLHKNIAPLRPIVCGGDDLTVIIQAALAVEFTKIFLQEFTNETKANFADWAKEIDSLKELKADEITTVKRLENGLTACAGIAFVKEKYPFHYAAELAEHLCKHAKTAAQDIKQANKLNITPACFSFYKIESAFVRTFDEIQKHELSSPIKENNKEGIEEEKNLTLSACPYYIEPANNDKYTATKLKEWLDAAKDYPAVRSRLRQVLSMLNTETNLENINLELSRIETLNPTGFKKFDISGDKKKLAHLHDFLSLNSIS